MGYATTLDAGTVGGAGTGLRVGFTAGPNLLNGDFSDWNFVEPGASLIDLDAIYSKLVVDGWIALIHPDANSTRSPAGYVNLYQIKSITAIARSNYCISAKISRAEVDTPNHLSEYYGLTRQTVALVQSEQLAAAPQPLSYPLYGTTIDLQDLRPDLAAATVVAITGTRQKLGLRATTNVITKKVQFIPDDDPSNPLTLNPGDIVTVTDPTPLPADLTAWSHTGPVTLTVEDASGRPGTVHAHFDDIGLAPSSSSDPQVSECALGVGQHDNWPLSSHRADAGSRSRRFQNCYDRESTTVQIPRMW